MNASLLLYVAQARAMQAHHHTQNIAGSSETNDEGIQDYRVATRHDWSQSTPPTVMNYRQYNLITVSPHAVLPPGIVLATTTSLIDAGKEMLKV